MVDGGPGAVPPAGLDAWLVTDTRGELITAIRRLAGARGVVPYAGPFHARGLCLTNREVVHTSHPFGEASAWNRPIRFAGGVGGHLDVQAVARAARRHRVTRLVFAHIGRPTLRALEAGLSPTFGEFATDRQVFVLARRAT
jgi:hypothetical protein